MEAFSSSLKKKSIYLKRLFLVISLIKHGIDRAVARMGRFLLKNQSIALKWCNSIQETAQMCLNSIIFFFRFAERIPCIKFMNKLHLKQSSLRIQFKNLQSIRQLKTDEKIIKHLLNIPPNSINLLISLLYPFALHIILF